MSVKHTHEEFIHYLLEHSVPFKKNEYDVIGRYNGWHNKVLCKCNKCGMEFSIPAGRLKNGASCTKCSGIKGVERVTDHESFLKAASKRCPDLYFLSEYTGRHNPIKCKCKLCGREFDQKPDRLLRMRDGKIFNHCPRCSRAPQGRDMECFKFLLKQVNANIDVGGEYINCKTHVDCHCNICGCSWKATPDNLLHGFGCPDCAIIKIRESETKTHEQFIEELTMHNTGFINGDFKIIGVYNGFHSKIKCYCNIHNKTYYTTPATLLRTNDAHGCKKCGRNIGGMKSRVKDEDFIRDVKRKNKYILNNEISIIDTYSTHKSGVMCKCNKCGREWLANTSSLLKGSGCKRCKGLEKKSKDAFIIELSEINPTVELISDYVNRNTNVACRCKKCGNEWYANPSHLIAKDRKNRTSCPKCSSSKGEHIIASYLDKNNITYETEKQFDGLFGVSGYRNLRYDFYLNEINTLIEYNGLQHYQPVKFNSKENNDIAEQRFKIQTEHDKRKFEYAKSNNIELITIGYFDMDNIEQILSSVISA